MRKYFRSFSNMLGQVVEETDPGMGRAGTVVDQVNGMHMLSQIETKQQYSELLARVFKQENDNKGRNNGSLYE